MILSLLKKHPQWSQICEISQTLQKNGYQSVLAGGCVRDALLGKIAKDIDIATDATPAQIEKIFKRVLMVGESFGVCRVMTEGDSGVDQNPVEVATFREESDYQDGRHPQKVIFSSIEKDAQRRDFTINAMFFDINKNKLIDLVEGEADLKKKILRTVGVPQERFQEDSLRLMRAARFAAQMDLQVQEDTLKAIQQNAGQLLRVSVERLQDEINKSFQIEKPSLFFKHLSQMGLDGVLFKDWIWDIDKFNIFFEKSCPPRWGWAALAFLQKKFSETEVIQKLRFFKLSNENIYFIRLCFESQNFLFEDQKEDLTKFIQLAKKQDILDVVVFWSRLAQAQKRTNPQNHWNEYVNKYFVNGKLPEMLINGDLLIQAGVPAGPLLGQKLEAAYELQLKNPQWTKVKILSSLGYTVTST
jgi:tRNA nucleotidyltransferase/poly(A) polymerase